jgi:hypothetical protein
MSYLRYVCSFAYSGVQHILCCVFMFCLSSSCVPTVAVSQDCPFLIAPSVFSNVYFCPVACVPGLPVARDCPFLIAPSVFSNVYFRPAGVASVSGLCPFLIDPSVFSKVYFRPVSCVPGVASVSGLSNLGFPFGAL